jgi:hypothetical protein
MKLTIEEARALTAKGRKQSDERARQEFNKILSDIESGVRSKAIDGHSTYSAPIHAGDDVVTALRMVFEDAKFTVTVGNRNEVGNIPITISW